MSNFVLTADKVKEVLTNTLQITFEVTDACNLRCKYGTCGQLYAGYDVHACTSSIPLQHADCE